MKIGMTVSAQKRPVRRSWRAMMMVAAATVALSGCQGITNFMSNYTPDALRQRFGTGDDNTVDDSGNPQQGDQTDQTAQNGTLATSDNPQNTQAASVSTVQQRQEIRNGLIADQSNAQYIGQQVAQSPDQTQPIAPPPGALPPVATTQVASAGNGALNSTYSQRLAEFSGGAAPMQPQSNDSGAIEVPATANGPFAGTMVQPLTDLGSSVQMATGVRALDSASVRRGNRFELAALSFGAGATVLSDSDKVQLQGVATLLKQKGGTVQVVGNRFGGATAIGDLVDLQLAAARAAVVANALVSLGVPPTRIYAGTGLDDGGVTVTDAPANVFVID